MREVGTIKKTKARAKRGRPKGATSATTRARILRAAWECFGARGFGATTNHEIGERAGITGAAIYQHFESKAALYIEAVRAAYVFIVPHFQEAVRETTGTRDGLVALTRAFATGYELEPAVAPFLSSIPVEMQRHPEVEKAILNERHEVFFMVVEIVSRGVERGEVRAEDAESVVSMFMAATIGLSVQVGQLGKTGFFRSVDAFARLLDGVLISPPAAPARGSERPAPKSVQKRRSAD
jgi:AcrR family transcriptional regulator